MTESVTASGDSVAPTVVAANTTEDTFGRVVLTISSFRAAWYLLDVYYLPAEQDISQLTAMAVGLVILILLRVTSCLHAGVSSDMPRSMYPYQ